MSLTVTSLNIEWFGRGGIISGTTNDEYRKERLSDFLLGDLSTTDIYVFQKITNLELLKEFLPEFHCSIHPQRVRHRHILLCIKKEIATTHFHIEDVDLGSHGLRPSAGITLNEEEITIIGPCQNENTQPPYQNYGLYIRFISDRCVLQVEI